MAPNAPIGEIFITILTILKKISATCSKNLITGLAGSPIAAAANPNNTAENKTGSNSPFARAPTTLSGIICIINAPKPCSAAAAFVY